MVQHGETGHRRGVSIVCVACPSCAVRRPGVPALLVRVNSVCDSLSSTIGGGGAVVDAMAGFTPRATPDRRGRGIEGVDLQETSCAARLAALDSATGEASTYNSAGRLRLKRSSFYRSDPAHV